MLILYWKKVISFIGHKAVFFGLLHSSEFFMPGLVDTHIHASQYSYAGTALDMPLLQWLNAYTFPVESCFKDLEFARKVYTQIVVSLPTSRDKWLWTLISWCETLNICISSKLLIKDIQQAKKEIGLWLSLWVKGLRSVDLVLILWYDPCALQRRTLRNGTTTACYFATIHTEASLLLGQIASKMSYTKTHAQTHTLSWMFILKHYSRPLNSLNIYHICFLCVISYDNILKFSIV